MAASSRKRFLPPLPCKRLMAGKRLEYAFKIAVHGAFPALARIFAGFGGHYFNNSLCERNVGESSLLRHYAALTE
ncbi:MAG: hypothetical protein HKL96_07155 [Phycisphaerales bacterium]|nr:hypothetical protein [Phycisphaerales bacterium]